jgi:hypothetical protein
MKVKGGAYIHGTHAASDMQILYGFVPEAVSLSDIVADSTKTDLLWYARVWCVRNGSLSLSLTRARCVRLRIVQD